MRTLRTFIDTAVPRCYDSNEEFSLYNWIHVCRLVEEADVAGEFGTIPRKTVSEVESSTTYQHLTRNVV